MTQAIWNGKVLAESDDVVVVDGFTYFPRDSVDPAALIESDHTSVCAWKGRAKYYTVVVDGDHNRDAAWYYPKPSVAASKVAGRIAFWRGVKVVQDASAASDRRPGLLERFRRRLEPPPVADPDQALAGAPGPVSDIDDASFEAATEGGWTVVDFWAPWCGPCKAFHPIFDQVARDDTTGIRFARCNVDANPQTSTMLNILSIPTVVLFDPLGNEVDRVVGVPPRKELTRLLQLATTPVSDHT